MYKIVYEALTRLILQSVDIEVNGSVVIDIGDMMETLKEKIDYEDAKIWKVQSFLDIKISYSAESNSSSLQRFWISFIDMVNILLNTICAIRLGQWELLLECIRDMLPYVFAYDKINYARYLTCILGEMLSLKEECPEVYEEFKKGNFSAQLTEGNLFSRSETDKVIKLLLIKTPGGTTGFSTNPNAVNRWELNAAYRAQLRPCFYKHINYNQQMYKHADLYPSRIKKDEDYVQSILKTINESFIDPFSDLGLLLMYPYHI